MKEVLRAVKVSLEEKGMSTVEMSTESRSSADTWVTRSRRWFEAWTKFLSERMRMKRLKWTRLAKLSELEHSFEMTPVGQRIISANQEQLGSQSVTNSPSTSLQAPIRLCSRISSFPVLPFLLCSHAPHTAHTPSPLSCTPSTLFTHHVFFVCI